jgi:hypothetical protein
MPDSDAFGFAVVVFGCLRAAYCFFCWSRLLAAGDGNTAGASNTGAFNALFSIGCAAAVWLVSRRPAGRSVSTASLVRRELTVVYALLLQGVAYTYAQSALPRTALLPTSVLCASWRSFWSWVKARPAARVIG